MHPWGCCIESCSYQKLQDHFFGPLPLPFGLPIVLPTGLDLNQQHTVLYKFAAACILVAFGKLFLLA